MRAQHEHRSNLDGCEERRASTTQKFGPYSYFNTGPRT